MASTVGASYKAGQIQATNAELFVRSLGFTPVRIRVVNLDNQIRVEWNEGLAAGKNLKIIADGTLSVLASGGVEAAAADANGNAGVKIPQLADINDTTTEWLLWEAWGY